MFDWLSGIVGEDTAPIATYILIFILLIVGFFVLRAALNRVRGGTFVHGGHGRKKRLAVIDAAPVDNRRRLVLVRRDNVEHLVLIGGMNDLVVERDIDAQTLSKTDAPASKLSSKSEEKKTEPISEPVAPIPAPKSQPAPVVAEPKPAPAPVAEAPKPAPAAVAPKIERPAPTEVAAPAAAPRQATKIPEATLASGAAAAITGLAVAQSSQTPESTVKEIVEPAAEAPGSTTVSAEPSFREYSEQETSMAAPSVDEPKAEPPAEEPFEEFVPIGAAKPSPSETQIPSPKVEPDNEADDADLEDEMERLLNKLTTPSAL